MRDCAAIPPVMRSLAVLLLALAPALALAQEPKPTPTPSPTPEVAPSPTTTEPPAEELPILAEAPPLDYGRFRLGGFWLTPSLQVGNIVYDSNVLNQPTGEHRSDVSASAGPSLLAVLPFGAAGRVEIDGTAQYLYFVRTIEKRRLIGAVRGSLLWDTERTQFDLTEAWARTNERPDPEVDARILRDIEITTLDLRRQVVGPFFIRGNGTWDHTRVLDKDPYLGNDLNKNLTRDRYFAGGELEYAATIKTSLVGGGYRQWDRFPLDPTRDGISDRAYGGIRVVSDTLLSGKVLLGYVWYQNDFDAVRRSFFITDSQLSWSFSPRTEFAAGYKRDLDISAFDTDGETPTLLREIADLHINKELSLRVDLQLSASHTRLLSDGNVTIVTPDGEVQQGVRNDNYWETRANLGYYIRENLRFGVQGSYNQRQSDVDYFGIKGFVFGVTLSFTPPQPNPRTRASSRTFDTTRPGKQNY